MSVTFRNSLLWLITIVILNLSFDLINIRFDLTEDKLYTISKETNDIVNNLDDRIFIKVFLEGNLSPNYKYLQKSIFDLLKNLKEINPSRIDFEFFNPSSSEDEEIRRKEYNQLFEQGLTAINDDQNNQGISTQSTVFPGAIIYYKDKSAPVNFLKNQLLNNQSQIQISVENLEFEIISTILYLQTNSTPKIAFISGNGQLDKEEVYDITYSSKYDNMKLSYYYDIEYVNIKEFPVDSITNDFDLNMQLDRLQKYSAIIIAKPTKSFNNLDKYLIDQYIMNGGKVLWLIDGVNANMDSLINKNNFITSPNNLNINDQLFKYGVRVNSDLIEDLRCTQIPIVTGYSNGLPQQSFFNWPYFPLIKSNSSHSISKGIDGVKCEFVSSIDLIDNSIEKTVLLSSSSKSRILPAPSKVSLGILENPPKRESFNKENFPVAVLLEGKFESVYKNRILPKNQKVKFKQESEDNKMIIVSDGDLIANKVSNSGAILPLGYDRYIDYIFSGNKYFILNSIQYLCDTKNVMSIKNKTINLRMLNKKKILNNRNVIVFINIILPLFILFLFALTYQIKQRNSYG